MVKLRNFKTIQRSNYPVFSCEILVCFRDSLLLACPSILHLFYCSAISRNVFQNVCIRLNAKVYSWPVELAIRVGY